MKEIVVIAPIMDAFEKAEQIAAEYRYDNVDVVLGSMGTGLVAAKEALAKGARVVVSRGGTYQLIKERLNAPVVEIKVSAYDILESFHKVEYPDEPIGVVGYNNVVYGFDILKQILKTTVFKIELKKEDDIYDVIKEHKKLGIKTYIGDANLTQIINSLNCTGIIIQSQKDSILTAIQEGRSILDATKLEKERTQQIETITDFVHDAIIAIDETGKIIIFNQMAENIFNVKKAMALNRQIQEVVANTCLPWVLQTAQPQLGRIQNIGDSKIATNRVPIVVDGKVKGAVATFQDITEVQNLEQKIRRRLSERGFSAKYTFADIIHQSRAVKNCIVTARKYAQYDTPMLITGESGVGKEMFCQSVHNYGKRSQGPFVAINCAAIPPTLIESEFFGYEEGSFTGASKKGKAGVFELAHNGTIFLDEISEIPKELQGRLLRVLQEKQVMRIGGDKVIPVDVKIISATNRDLQKMMREGNFRKDLYFRISILMLHIPSLAERKEDLIMLVDYFIHKYSAKYGKKPLLLTPQVEKALLNREYEGNIRELEGVIERCVILSGFESVFAGEAKTTNDRSDVAVQANFRDLQGEELDLKTMELQYIREIYAKTGGNTKQSCEILKIDRSTLWRKLKES